MQAILQELVVGSIFSFLLIFMRFGIALLIMPGIGDSFVSPNVRLLFALGISFVLTPILSPHLPAIPAGEGQLILLLLSEAFIGFFIGTVMRILVSALDTAGMVISYQAGFSNAQLFNPVTGTQGSLVGALYSSLGVTIMLVADVHHQMLASVVDSYQLFPANGTFPDTGSVSEVISQTVNTAFKIGVQMSIPFLIVGTLIQIGFGLLGKLMPQIQIFFLAMPVQIFLSLIMLSLTLSTAILFWLNGYESILAQFLAPR